MQRCPSVQRVRVSAARDHLLPLSCLWYSRRYSTFPRWVDASGHCLFSPAAKGFANPIISGGKDVPRSGCLDLGANPAEASSVHSCLRELKSGEENKWFFFSFFPWEFMGKWQSGCSSDKGRGEVREVRNEEALKAGLCCSD